MKPLISLPLALLCALPAWSQQLQKRMIPQAPPSVLQQKAPAASKAVLPEVYVPETAPGNRIVTASGANYRDVEEQINSTRWDAQAYGCMPSRVFANSDGDPVAHWLYQKNTDDTNDRGTGSSVRSGGAWSNSDPRIETVRTGFPAVTQLSDGTIAAVAHATGFTPNRIHLSRKAPGATTWIESDLPNSTGQSLLWPYIASGGPDGKTLHVLAITMPVANGGVLYNNVDGQLLYWRSTNGGSTWDIVSQIIPGIDNSKFLSNGACTYSITARGNTAAIGIFSDWNDIVVYKSEDNGSNWSPLTVRDFPDSLENWVSCEGCKYDTSHIGYIDTLAPDPLAIFTSDGFGSVLIDHDDKVHVWFGRMYVIDNDSTANGPFYYPGMNGLCYWNENRATDSIEIITGALDYDGDNTLNIASNDDIGPYFNSLSSFPSTGIDDQGTIFLAYSAIHELYRSSGAEVDNIFRHVYLMRSEDGGNSWGDPLDIIDTPYVSDIIYVEFYEAVYPAIPQHIDSKIHLVYQQDFLPGTNIWGTHHSAVDNYIVYVGIDTGDVAVTTREPFRRHDFRMSLSPNPATAQTLLSATLINGKDGRIRVFDVLGNLVLEQAMPEGSGRQSVMLQTGNLANGMYFVNLQESGFTQTTRLIKR